MLYNTSSGRSYLHVGSLPNPGPEKQYRLWAIVGGQPIDPGVFDWKNDFIEIDFREGGNPVPTLSEIYVLGEV